MSQLERPDLHAAIEQRYPDNTTEDITPLRLRDGLHELVDSLFVIATDTGAIPNVPEYKAGTPYVLGYTVRYTSPGGTESFYRALASGKLTAPGPGNLVQWKVVPGPVTATALWQAIDLLQAQGIEGVSVQPGRLYQIDMGLNSAGKQQLVYLMGLENYFDVVRGVLEVDGMRTAIEHIDLNAGTWQVAGTALGSGTVLRFVQDTEYNPLYSGTFTVDTTTTRLGAVVVAYLGPACTAPTLDPQVFRTKNVYVAGKTLEYCFKVSATGFIEYIITVLD